MSSNYLIADMLIRIKNAGLAGHKELTIPYSKTCLALGKVLSSRGFIESAKKKEKSIIVGLKFAKRRPVLTSVRIISKPGLRVYVSKKEIPRQRRGMQVSIVSTPKGLMTSEEARKEGLGGELLCQVW